MERAGVQVEKTYQANPGEVEEAEFLIDLSVEMDKDGSLGFGNGLKVLTAMAKSLAWTNIGTDF